MRLGLIVVLALLATGCGAASDSDGSLAAPTDTARISISWEGEGSVMGEFDFANDVGVVSDAATGLPLLLTAESAYESIEARPEGAEGKLWVRRPRNWFDPLYLAPVVEGPAELRMFLEAADDGEQVGEGVVRGVPVTYYTARIRMDQYQASLPPGRRDDLSSYIEEWEGVPIRLARDHEGRIRRAQSGFYGGDITIDVYDYGVEVEARDPDMRTVLTWEEYEKLLGAECEKLKEKGLEKTKPHCIRHCSAGESEAA